MELRAHCCTSTWYWFHGLPSEIQSDFQWFAKSFTENFIDSQCPSNSAFYYAREHSTETLETFFERFCYLAREARVDIQRDWRTHFQQFTLQLVNPDSKSLITGQRFASCADFRDYLDDLRKSKAQRAYLSTNAIIDGSTAICTSTPRSTGNRSTAFSAQLDSSLDQSVYAMVDDTSLLASTMEDMAQCYALNLHPSNARKIPCTKCNRKHFMGRDGQCWTGILCTVCNVRDHPAESCFQRCKNDSCASKTIPHHKEKCPPPNESSSATLQRNYEALIDAFKDKGVAIPAPPPLKG